MKGYLVFMVCLQFRYNPIGSVYIAVYNSQSALLVLFTFIFWPYFLTTFALSS